MKVLLIDDQPDMVEYIADELQTRTDGRIRASAMHPGDVADDDITGANLILVDYRIEQWPGRDAAAELLLRPRDGRALAATVRAHGHALQQDQPIGIALLSGHLGDLTGPLPDEKRQHVIASRNDLEWAFAKKDSRLVERIQALCEAVASLSSSWHLEEAQVAATRKELEALLGLDVDAGGWRQSASEDVEECRPPIHRRSENEAWHGLTILRWILHKVLPYPTFLLSDVEAAQRLRLTIGEFERFWDASEMFRAFMAGCRYEGVLHAFGGRRWWKAGLEEMSWKLTEGMILTTDEFRERLVKRFGEHLRDEVPKDPVVEYGVDGVATGRLCELGESVRFQADGWPPYADVPRAHWKSVKEAGSLLERMVVADDRPKMERLESTTDG